MTIFKKLIDKLFSSSIEEKNKAFAKLSRLEKRKAVLQDAFALSNSNNVQMTMGTYFNVINPGKRISNSKQFQEYLLTTPICDVCAKGALFCSKVRLNNEFYPSEYLKVHNEEILKYLGDIFEEWELALIEAVFERNASFLRNVELFYPNYPKYTNLSACYDHFFDYVKNNYSPASQKRFQSLITNIIEADTDFIKGVFKYADSEETTKPYYLTIEEQKKANEN